MQSMVFEVWEDNAKRWSWRLLANGQRVAQGESYRNEKDCMWAISLVKSSVDAPVTRAEASCSGRDAADR